MKKYKLKIGVLSGTMCFLVACSSQSSIVDNRSSESLETLKPASSANYRQIADPPSVTVASGGLASRSDVQRFIRRMGVKHGFETRDLRIMFTRVRIRSDILALMNRPAEGKPWAQYRKIFLNQKRIANGVRFWRRHQAVLARAERVYGVPAEIIVAIIGVETLYGGNTGSHRVIDALATLAFEYPRRSKFFTSELEHFLLLTRREGVNPLKPKGSYAGAMGLPQFMPSSFRSYAVDFDNDGHRDIWENPADAIGSVANYLSRHGWRRGQSVAVPAEVNGSVSGLISKRPKKPRYRLTSLQARGIDSDRALPGNWKAALMRFDGDPRSRYWLGFQNFYSITRYNHSNLYAMAVYQLSQQIKRRAGGL